MAKRDEPRGVRGAGSSRGVEWVGGTTSMPATVATEGGRYRPEALVWMGAEGMVLGFTMARPGDLLGTACESLDAAIREPMIGFPHAPTRLRVASADLAAMLRRGHQEIEVVCAPTPELEEVLASMRSRISEDDADEPGYLSPEVGPEVVAPFFRAAAGLYRAKPWEVVPSDQDVFSVRMEALGVQDAVLSIIGQMGESRGFVFFDDLDDFETFCDAVDAFESGEMAGIPPHLSLNFERGSDLPEAMQRDVAEHRWDVASEDAYPFLLAVDDASMAHPPTAREFTIAEAISRALPTVLAEKAALLAAWKGGEPISRTVTVPTHAGEIELTLRAPYPLGVAEGRPVDDLMAAFADLAGADEVIEPRVRGPLEEDLLDLFDASPEAEGVTDLAACNFVMDFAADHFGETIATLQPMELREIIFRIIPRKVSIDASEARWIIEVNRAFFTFLKRAFDLASADDCLRVLAGDAVEKLEAALSDSGNFGMAKSWILAGHAAGFDVETKEGLDAWMKASRGRSHPALRQGSASAPAAPDATQGAGRPKQGNKNRKNKRKASRKARRRNR